MKYDLIIIGGGAGGFAAAIKANELGIKTLMINSGLPIGGTCVNVGCVPSKFLIHKSKISEIVSPDFNFEKIVEEEIDLVERLRKEKYENVLKNLKNVDFIEGKAKFVGENEIEVSRNDADLTQTNADLRRQTQTYEEMTLN